MRSLFYKIGYNTFIQILGKSISTFFGFISIGLLTRYLGQSGYGNFSLTFAYLSIFGILSDLGLQITMVRELAKNEKTDPVIYGTYFCLKLALVVVSTIVAIIALSFYPYSNFIKLGIILASFGVAIGNINNYGMVVFQANVRLDLVSLVEVVVKIITTAFVVIFIYLNRGLYSIINSIFLGNLFGAVIIFWLLRRFIKFSTKFNLNLARDLIIKSFPVGLISFLATLFFKFDTIILSLFRETSEVGIYSLAYGVFENLLIIWGFYMATAYPLLVRFLPQKDRFKKLWQSSALIAVGFSTVFVILGYIFSPLVVKILGGEQFNQSVTVLRILLFSLPFFFINNLFFHTFLVKENLKVPGTAIFSSLVLNLSLSLLFIPRWGYIFAAINALIVECFLTIFYSLFFVKTKFIDNA